MQVFTAVFGSSSFWWAAKWWGFKETCTFGKPVKKWSYRARKYAMQTRRRYGILL